MGIIHNLNCQQLSRYWRCQEGLMNRQLYRGLGIDIRQNSAPPSRQAVGYYRMWTLCHMSLAEIVQIGYTLRETKTYHPEQDIMQESSPWSPVCLRLLPTRPSLDYSRPSSRTRARHNGSSSQHRPSLRICTLHAIEPLSARVGCVRD